jgi:hypothetical protein
MDQWIDGSMEGWVDEMDDGGSVIRIPWLAWHGFILVLRGKKALLDSARRWMERWRMMDAWE